VSQGAHYHVRTQRLREKHLRLVQRLWQTASPELTKTTSAVRSSYLHDNNTTPYRKHSMLPNDIEEQLAHRQWEGGGQEIRN